MTKKWQPALLLLLGLAASRVFAVCADEEIEKLYLQENASGLDARISGLAAAADRTKAEALLLGLAAYRVADLKLLDGDEHGARSALSAAVSALKTQLMRAPDAELGALLGLVYGMQIRMSPLRGMFLGDDADQVLAAALDAEPNNPRPHLAAGLNLLYKPSGFGGGADKAAAQLNSAVELFERSPAKTDGVCWGGDDATLALARAKLKLGERVGAIALVESVLARTPGHRPAQRLMEEIRRAATKAG